jgi:hypothetical protein
MAKDKDGKKYTQAQLMALKASVRTDLASKSTIGNPTVDPSKGRAPKYDNKNKPLAGFGTPMGTSIGISQPTKLSNIIGAAATAVTGGAASGFKIASKQVVSQATKNLQRELSKELKEQSFKGLSKTQRQAKYEGLDDLTPEEFAEYKGIPKELSKKVSESMKKTTTTKKNIQRRK